eukprot:scaffold179823_cov38-Prasinocladus_malaysianus.AAC.1
MAMYVNLFRAIMTAASVACGCVAQPLRWAAEPLLRCQPRKPHPGLQPPDHPAGRAASKAKGRLARTLGAHLGSPPLQLQHIPLLGSQRRDCPH